MGFVPVDFPEPYDLVPYQSLLCQYLFCFDINKKGISYSLQKRKVWPEAKAS